MNRFLEEFAHIVINLKADILAGDGVNINRIT